MFSQALGLLLFSTHLHSSQLLSSFGLLHLLLQQLFFQLFGGFLQMLRHFLRLSDQLQFFSHQRLGDDHITPGLALQAHNLLVSRENAGLAIDLVSGGGERLQNGREKKKKRKERKKKTHLSCETVSALGSSTVMEKRFFPHVMAISISLLLYNTFLWFFFISCPTRPHVAGTGYYQQQQHPEEGQSTEREQLECKEQLAKHRLFPEQIVRECDVRGAQRTREEPASGRGVDRRSAH
jgi:hypothetical protein